MTKRGQVAIFVIVAIVILVAVVSFAIFYARKSIVENAVQRDNGIESMLDSCVRAGMQKEADAIIPQGGFLEPRNYREFENFKVAYLCYNNNYYEPCITQYPVYLTQIAREFEKDIHEEIASCFAKIDEDLRAKGKEVSSSETKTNIILRPDIIGAEIEREMQIRDKDGSQKYNSFTVSLKNPLYDLAYVAQEITRQEARYCYFETVGFMLLYPDFDIRKRHMSDGTEIYSITDLESGYKMNIAIRGCAIPAGF